MDRFGKVAHAFGWFEIEFDRMSAVGACLGDEPCGGINVAARANRDEEICLGKRITDVTHAVGHFAKPNDVRAHAAGFIAAGAGEIGR